MLTIRVVVPKNIFGYRLIDKTRFSSRMRNKLRHPEITRLAYIQMGCVSDLCLHRNYCQERTSFIAAQLSLLYNSKINQLLEEIHDSLLQGPVCDPNSLMLLLLAAANGRPILLDTTFLVNALLMHGPTSQMIGLGIVRVGSG